MSVGPGLFSGAPRCAEGVGRARTGATYSWSRLLCDSLLMGRQENVRFATEFKLSVTKALGDQLFDTLRMTETAPLSIGNLN